MVPIVLLRVFVIHLHSAVLPARKARSKHNVRISNRRGYFRLWENPVSLRKPPQSFRFAYPNPVFTGAPVLSANLGSEVGGEAVKTSSRQLNMGSSEVYA
jgi:hypothetical protein